tara:strand:- start:286 stop:390 length:105 start_codon:yes stop_codon:yes gene_type:complete
LLLARAQSALSSRANEARAMRTLLAREARRHVTM